MWQSEREIGIFIEESLLGSKGERRRQKASPVKLPFPSDAGQALNCSGALRQPDSPELVFWAFVAVATQYSTAQAATFKRLSPYHERDNK